MPKNLSRQFPPFHESIVYELDQLKIRESGTVVELDAALRALLWLISGTSIPENHIEIQNAIRRAMEGCETCETNTLYAWEAAIIQLYKEGCKAVENALRKEEERKAAEAREQQMKNKEIQQGRTGDHLSRWDDSIRSRQAKVVDTEIQLLEWEARLKRREKRLKNKAKSKVMTAARIP